VTDHYATLALSPDATDADIKRRYRKLMREVHPDANIDDPQANRKAARINAAYEAIGDPVRRRAYDAQRQPRRPVAGTMATNRRYSFWAEQPDWENIVAENVPPARPPHVHAYEPLIEPAEVEVDMSELDAQPRVSRRITITNQCDCTLVGNVSTSETWLRGPVGHLKAGPGQRIEFEVQIIAAKVVFPGISRVVFVAKDWSGTIPVRITGFVAKPRNVYPATDSAYVASRRRRATKR
jgi:hypothetical protein